MAKKNGGEKAPRYSSQPMIGNGKMGEAVPVEVEIVEQSDGGGSPEIVANDDKAEKRRRIGVVAMAALQNIRNSVIRFFGGTKCELTSDDKTTEGNETNAPTKTKAGKSPSKKKNLKGAHFAWNVEKNARTRTAAEEELSRAQKAMLEAIMQDDDAYEEAAEAYAKAKAKVDVEASRDNDDADDTSEAEGDATEVRKTSSEKEKEKGQKKSHKGLIVGGVAVALAAALAGGAYASGIDQRKADNNSALETATETLHELTLSPDEISSDNVDEMQKQFNEQMDALIHARDNQGDPLPFDDPDPALVTSANELLEGDQVSKYQEAIDSSLAARNELANKADLLGMSVESYVKYQQKASKLELDSVETYLDYEQAAGELGISIEDYSEYGDLAERTNLTIEQVKQFSEGHGVPADKLNTPEAVDYVRDGRDDKTAVGETALTNESEDVEARRAEVKYLAATNPMVAAQIMAAINEDTTADAGVDGLETGTQLINQYLTDFAGDYDVYQDAVQDVITPWIDGADASIFEAKHIRQYSVGDLTQTDDQLTVTNSYQDNNGGNPHVLVFENGDVTIWFKMGCGGQLTVPIPIQVVVERHAYTSNQTTTYTPNQTTTYTPNQTTTTTTTNSPVDPPTITTTDAKNAQADPAYGTGQVANRVASDESAEMVGATGDGAADSGSYVGADGEKHEVGDQGDDVVVEASDGHGTAAGIESERPGDSPR